MSIIDDIRIRQDWSEDGYTFEKEVPAENEQKAYVSVDEADTWFEQGPNHIEKACGAAARKILGRPKGTRSFKNIVDDATQKRQQLLEGGVKGIWCQRETVKYND